MQTSNQTFLVWGGAGRAINSTIKPWGTAVDVEVVSASHRIGGTFTLFLPNFENWTKHGSRDFLVPQVSVDPRSHTWFGAEALHFVHADICVSSDLVGRSREQQPTTLEISVQNSKSSGVREHHFETGLHHKGSEHRWIHILSAGKQTNRPSFLLKYGWRLFFLSHLFILPYTAERRDGRNFQCCTYISPHTIWASWMSNVNKFDLMLYLTVIYCNYLQLTNIYYIYIYVFFSIIIYT